MNEVALPGAVPADTRSSRNFTSVSCMHSPTGRAPPTSSPWAAAPSGSAASARGLVGSIELVATSARRAAQSGPLDIRISQGQTRRSAAGIEIGRHRQHRRDLGVGSVGLAGGDFVDIGVTTTHECSARASPLFSDRGVTANWGHTVFLVRRPARALVARKVDRAYSVARRVVYKPTKMGTFLALQRTRDRGIAPLGIRHPLEFILWTLNFADCPA